MKKFSFTIPLMKGINKAFDINDENGISRAKIQRYYPNLLNILSEIFLTGWEVNVKGIQGGKELMIKNHFHWIKNEWSILERGSKIGTLTNIKKIELGDSKELIFRGKKYYYYNQPLETQTLFQDEEENIIAIIDYKLFDLLRKKEIVLYSDELPVSLLVGIDYVSSQMNK